MNPGQVQMSFSHHFETTGWVKHVKQGVCCSLAASPSVRSSIIWYRVQRTRTELFILALLLMTDLKFYVHMSKGKHARPNLIGEIASKVEKVHARTINAVFVNLEKE